MRHPIAAVLIVGAVLAGTTGRVLALEARILEVRAVGPMVRARIDLRDLFPQKFRDIVNGGGALHVRIQAELWEDRPLWDRVVRPALVSVFRIARDPATSRIAVSDAVGLVQSSDAVPDPLSLRVDVAPADAMGDDSRYYLRLMATIGTLAEKDIEAASDAAFGQDDGSVSIGTVGKVIFNAVLQATDYLQSVTTEATSARMTGREIRGGRE